MKPHRILYPVGVRLTYSAEFDGEVTIGDEHTEYRWLTLDELKAAELDTYLTEIMPLLQY